MKIGIFTETYRPTINGVVMSIDTFKQELEKKGHEYAIFAPFNKHQTGEEKNVYRFPSLHFHRDPIYPIALPMLSSLALRQFPEDILESLDIIHIQHFSFMGQYGLAAGIRYNIPVVYTYHTMAELYTSYIPLLGSLFKEPIRALTRYTAKHSNAIVAPTNSVKAYLRSIGVRHEITVLPTGIHTNLYKRTHTDYARAKFHIPPDQQILLYIGRLAHEKNIDFLLKTFERVLQANRNVHLLFIGNGPDKERYERYATVHKLHHYVTFSGFLERSETIKLFGAADLFVFPSVSDTQGIVIIEAMASGTVPVAIDRLGPHDLIKNGVTGALTRLNIEEYSDTIINLLANTKKRDMMSKAAIQEAHRYDAQVTARSMENLYTNLINHAKRQKQPTTT